MRLAIAKWGIGMIHGAARSGSTSQVGRMSLDARHVHLRGRASGGVLAGLARLAIPSGPI
jgi:hypothetical protein